MASVSALAPRATPGWRVGARRTGPLNVRHLPKQTPMVVSSVGGVVSARLSSERPLAPSLAPRPGGGAPLRRASAIGGRGSKYPRVQTTAPPRPDTKTTAGNEMPSPVGKKEEARSTNSEADSRAAVEEAPRCNLPNIDRGLGLRRALSDETQSRPFQPLGGEVLHIAWSRSSEDGKVSRAEGESDRDCLEALLEHFTVDPERQEEILERVVRGWSDVTLTLGDGYYCRLQRFSEFDTLTLSGPGSPEEPLSRAVRPWQWMLPEGWLSTVPGKVFLCAHVVVRNTDVEDAMLVDENDLWNELQMVSNAVGWERRERGYAEGETSRSAARDEALTAIAEMVTSDDEGGEILEWDQSGEYDFGPSEDSGDEDNGEGLSWFQLAELKASKALKKSGGKPVEVRGQGTGRRSMLPIIVTEECIEEGGTVEECIDEAFNTEPESSHPDVSPPPSKKKKKNGEGSRSEGKKPEKRVRKYAGFGTDRWQRQQRDKRKKEARRHQMEDAMETVDGTIGGNRIDPSTVPAQWQRWGSQLESSRIVAFDAGGGVRFYANYHLDNEGGMSCVLLAPRGASVVRAARQLQRFFTIEQYRLIILQRLPGAKSMYPRLSKLETAYETLSQSIRRMNEGSTPKGVFQKIGRQWRGDRRKQTQEFLEKITELEQATAQELARAKTEAASARAYADIIVTRFEEADYRPLGGEVRFMPPFVRKRLDPAVSTIFSVAERAQILSDALERTNALLQATVNVRLQLNYERLSLYALIFTCISVFATLVTSVTTPGPMQDIFHWLMKRLVRPLWGPIASVCTKLAGL